MFGALIKPHPCTKMAVKHSNMAIGVCTEVEFVNVLWFGDGRITILRFFIQIMQICIKFIDDLGILLLLNPGLGLA